MAAVIPLYTSGPITFFVEESVTGGNVVELRTDQVDTVGNAVSGSLTVAGVALTDAAPFVSGGLAGTDPTTNTLGNANAAALPPQVAVINNCVIQVTYAAAATAGQRLMAAALGQVEPWDGSSAAKIIGWCFETTAAGAVGLARIRV